MNEKILKNALRCEMLSKLNKEDRHEIVKKLLKGKTQKQLGKELGIPEGTIHNWFTLRDSNKSKSSLSNIYMQLKKLKVEDITDWGRIEMIKEVIDDLLRNKPLN